MGIVKKYLLLQIMKNKTIKTNKRKYFFTKEKN